MTSKLFRKPCQVVVKIDPNLDHGVGVVSAFIINVDLDSNLVVGVASVGGHVVAVILKFTV